MREALRLGGKRRAIALREDSALRRIDPRVKLALTLSLALTVMLPVERLAVFCVLFWAWLYAMKLVEAAARQLRRVIPLLVILFALDWIFIGLDLAVLITLRIALLVAGSVLLFATTTPEELRLALGALGMPYRLAFAISVAFQALPLVRSEWRAIWEAQAARGALPQRHGWRSLPARLADYVALLVPAVVLTAKRAWAMTEAAHARGFDSPQRTPYHVLRLTWWDGALLGGTLIVLSLLLYWR
jgi:energy-coupling factor transporter transmembrane protein EcfT